MGGSQLIGKHQYKYYLKVQKILSHTTSINLIKLNSHSQLLDRFKTFTHSSHTVLNPSEIVTILIYHFLLTWSYIYYYALALAIWSNYKWFSFDAKKSSTIVHVQDGGGRTPTGDRHMHVSKTVIDLEISSSLVQHSKNSSKVTTPSWFISIF